MSNNLQTRVLQKQSTIKTIKCELLSQNTHHKTNKNTKFVVFYQSGLPASIYKAETMAVIFFVKETQKITP